MANITKHLNKNFPNYVTPVTDILKLIVTLIDEKYLRTSIRHFICAIVGDEETSDADRVAIYMTIVQKYLDGYDNYCQSDLLEKIVEKVTDFENWGVAHVSEDGVSPHCAKLLQFGAHYYAHLSPDSGCTRFLCKADKPTESSVDDSLIDYSNQSDDYYSKQNIIKFISRNVVLTGEMKQYHSLPAISIIQENYMWIQRCMIDVKTIHTGVHSDMQMELKDRIRWYHQGREFITHSCNQFNMFRVNETFDGEMAKRNSASKK